MDHIAALSSLQASHSGADKIESLVKGARGVKQEREIERVSKEFEAVFLTEMLRPIFESVDVNDTFGGGRAEEVFRGLMLDEYGKTLSRSGGIGLADHVKATLIKAQGQNTKE